MHESQLARKLVATLEAAVKERSAKSVKSVKVRLGGVHWIDSEAFRELFALFSQGTTCEGAELFVEEAQPKAKCLQCGTNFVPHDHDPACPRCGSSEIEIDAEPDLQILEISLLMPSLQ
ncbi:MAG: hydrogenase maturation nickel metallochaperone HypA [Armatimonadetes bacterium]|nr:hydrogenase maturation nickel metallochaperone HypA [Armatimonadota bacterium]MCX7966970.1 hydrogenase maturation nickel metallochaperone HypA [Armatimonadota bacterium]MDW8142127.1 hydrogenase maturation nickel metallochaperone HypA [Armatimonadota bacterium]